MSCDEVRTLEQNKKFHAMVRDIAAQVKWADDYMDEEEWKRLFLAALWGQKVVPNPLNPQSAFIVINTRRSRGLVKPEMADLIAEIEVFGNERGVAWSEQRAAA